MAVSGQVSWAAPGHIATALDIGVEVLRPAPFRPPEPAQTQGEENDGPEDARPGIRRPGVCPGNLEAAVHLPAARSRGPPDARKPASWRRAQAQCQKQRP